MSVSPQHSPLQIQIKHCCMVGKVFVSLNPGISLREEVGFNSNSNAVNTHYPDTQGDLKSCMCM